MAMDPFEESCVVYDGMPISSGGAHRLGKASARDAVNSWLGFLEGCTAPSPIRCWFQFPETPGLKVAPEVVREVGRAFPPIEISPAHHKSTIQYVVPRNRLDEAVALFESLEPLPMNKWGMAPIWLWFRAEFRLLSPGGELWPGQDPTFFNDFVTRTGVTLGASATGLGLQAKRHMGLGLSIPRASDRDLGALVPWLQESLPFRLSAKHWTRWTLTKNKLSYRGNKIVPPSLANGSTT